MESGSKINEFRDASFAAYLNSPKENLILKLTESVQFPHPATRSNKEVFIPTSLERTKSESEIGIFGAEKYFGMPLDDCNHDSDQVAEAVNSYPGKQATLDQVEFDPTRLRMRAKFGTPSATSEASCNSQTALLSSSSRNLQRQGKTKKVNERWLLSVFACIGTCSDKESVHVQTNIAHRSIHGNEEIRKEGNQVGINTHRLEGERKQSQPRFQVKGDDFVRSYRARKTSIGSVREDYFLLPTVDSGVRSLEVRRDQEQAKAMEAVERKSIEVFGSHMKKKEDIAMNLERKLSVLSWDAIPKEPNVRSTRSTYSHQVCDEVASDGSSDLFEIENLTTSSVQPINFTKQASYGLSACMSPTSLYEPSERSIEWSVITASAADFSCAVSDYDDKKLVDQNGTNLCINSMNESLSRPNGLLGCKSNRAVEVTKTVYKRNDKTISHLQQLERSDASLL